VSDEKQAKNLIDVDWSKIPVPIDDGKAIHLVGKHLPNINLSATNGELVDLSSYNGYTVLFIYPRTGQPGKPSLLDNWDDIPGARGCTPQSCSFRDHFAYFLQHEIRVFGLSTQDTLYQKEVVERLQLPYLILSDENLTFANAMQLPIFEVSGIKLLKRMAIIIYNGVIKHVFYPVFPPDQNAIQVIKWFKDVCE
jgi:peroxiredoxin